MSTDELDAFASAIVHPVGRVKTTDPAVAVVVATSSGDVRRDRRAALAADGLEATIATTTVPPSQRSWRCCARSGDESIPADRLLPGLFGWIHTPSALRHEARALHLHHRFFYLEPANPTFGQLLLGAQPRGGVPVRGSASLAARRRSPGRGHERGDVVVVTVTGSAMRPAA